MTKEEAIDRLKEARVGHYEFLSMETLNMAIKALEQEPCEDEYIKVPKKALKYRTAGMVAYNAEWLKNNFDIERAVICGAQEPCGDAISRENAIIRISWDFPTLEIPKVKESLDKLPSVTPQPKWIPVSEELPEEGKEVLTCSNGGFIEIQSLEDSCADIYWENRNGDWSDIDEVIAWMPLPTPYDPQESGDKE